MADPFIEAFVAASRGEIFRVFDQQDSGCVSYGVAIDAQRWFVKHAVAEDAVPSLRRAIQFHEKVKHPAIIGLDRVVRGADDLALVYEWVDGELLHPPRRADPADLPAAAARFRSQPIPVVLGALAAVIDAHLEVARHGFVSVDLYDGCFIYDFDRRAMRMCDFDEYRPGPFVVDTDRLPGSTRFMAPEDFQRGATIDERTMVFHLGRTAQVLASDDERRWRASPTLAAVAERATSTDPAGRFATVRDFAASWTSAARAGS